MGFVDILFSFCTFWAGLHALKYLLARFYLSHATRQLTRNRAVLPLDRSPQSNVSTLSYYVGHKVARAFTSLKLNVSLSAVNLRIETTLLDRAFDRASILLVQAPPRSPAARARRFIEKIYSIGAAVGLLGMGAVYILLLWSCLMVFHVSEQASGSQNKTNHTLDDEPLSSSDDVNMRGSGLAVQPLIPGVTVPFSHLPVLLAALLFSQIIHEAGHALSTIPENVPIHSVGLGLFVCLPSAFVSLSSVAFEKLPPLPRMRIAAAGAYHNLALWFILAILGWSGLGKLLSQGWTGWGTSFGPYKHVNDLGVSVQSIDPESDLGQYLYPGDIITRIEDTVLAHASLLAQRRTSLQLWHDLLLHHHYNVTIDDLPDMGWCVDAKWYKDQPSECCTDPSSSPLACFSPSNTTGSGSCLDPFKVFNPSQTPMSLAHGRCSTTCITAGTAAAEDEPEQICVQAKGVTRIGVVRGNGLERTVLWSGPSEEIWQQVHVGDIAPRYWFIPSGLPELFALFASYTSTITLSLFFLNLLPIRYLDGAQLLSALLDIYAPSTPTSSFSLSQIQASAEEGHSKYEYSFTYETPERRPQIMRRHTSNPSTPPVVTTSNGDEYEREGWIETNRKRIENTAEGLAVALITMVAIGNAWVFMG